MNSRSVAYNTFLAYIIPHYTNVSIALCYHDTLVNPRHKACPTSASLHLARHDCETQVSV